MSTQIKVTPEQLEQAAKTVRNTRSSLEYIHRDFILSNRIYSFSVERGKQ